MNKHLNKLIILTFIVAGHFSFAQTTFTVGGIAYKVTDAAKKKVAVTSKNPKYTGDITIPASVTNGGNNYSVTSIGIEAFKNCSQLMSVSIPNSVTSIGDGAFSHCSGLTSVSIPNSVTSIGGNAFTYCSSLTSVNIPNSVTSIRQFAFTYCSSLTSVICEVVNPNAITMGIYIFYHY